MAKPVEIILSKDQIAFMTKICGEKSTKSAFRMFMRAMEKENIRVDKMPILIDKLIEKTSGESKG